MVVTCEQMTIKHSMYMQKVPFPFTERACVFFFWFFGIRPLEEKLHGAKCCKLYGPEGVINIMDKSLCKNDCVPREERGPLLLCLSCLTVATTDSLLEVVCYTVERERGDL